MENGALSRLREGLRGTPYEGQLFLVGGFVRDKLLGATAAPDDIDLVLEGDALALARWLWQRRIADHKPVEYGQFGTTSVHISGAKVEIVTARAETYRQGSRKPIVTPGTLATDAQRRDFTVNTFLENLHTGEIVDPLDGRASADLAHRILRTPLDPDITFTDDPLRMLRACRFAAKLGFAIADETRAALSRHAHRLTPEFGISFERIRDELFKTLPSPGAATGLRLMRETGLLTRFAPELAAMHGVTQNRFHRFDVWEHTMVALGQLPTGTDLEIRLAVLFHDVGKPLTRTAGDDGEIHFYDHETAGASIARDVLSRLRCSNDTIERVTALVAAHMRYGAYDAGVWTDRAVRKLIRAVGAHRQDLFVITRADIAACNTDDFPSADLDSLAARMETLDAGGQVSGADSPLSGQEIMIRLQLRPGPQVGRIKTALTDAVASGDLAADDKDGAEALARQLLGEQSSENPGNPLE